jgi:hypothetical protein
MSSPVLILYACLKNIGNRLHSEKMKCRFNRSTLRSGHCMHDCHPFSNYVFNTSFQVTDNARGSVTSMPKLVSVYTQIDARSTPELVLINTAVVLTEHWSWRIQFRLLNTPNYVVFSIETTRYRKPCKSCLNNSRTQRLRV